MSVQKKPTWFRRLVRASWAVAAMFAVGYLPTVMLADVRPALVGSAVLAGFFGGRGPSVRRGVVWGALLGTIAGLSLAGALVSYYTRPLPPPLIVTCISLPAATAVYAATGLETVAALALGAALTSPYGHHLPGYLTATYVVTTVVLCTASAAVFALLAARRRKAQEDKWKMMGS